MASTFSVGENHGVHEDGGSTPLIRVILADTQAIFRAGLRKIFALEDDIRVVGQAKTLPQTQSAVTKFSADVLIFESALAPNPVEAVAELLRQAPHLKIVVVTPASDEQLTLDLFRRGAHGILSARWNLRYSSTACAKSPPENPGSRTRQFTGSWKPFAATTCAPPEHARKFNSRPRKH